jgi:hypothetical protein
LFFFFLLTSGFFVAVKLFILYQFIDATKIKLVACLFLHTLVGLGKGNDG